MQFPAFDHAVFLDRAWKGGAPTHNIGSSSFIGGSWTGRGLPALPTDFDSHTVNLSAQADLRAALARHVGTSEDRVFAAAGTSGGNLATMLWAFRPGCNFVVERPVYSQLAATARGLGAEVRYVDRDSPDTPAGRKSPWRLDPEKVAAACDDDTALIVLASPNNPTQAAASEDDLRALADIAERHDAHVLVDQVYRELTDDPLAAPLHDRLITTAGFNKSWGLPGIRIGWLTARPDLVEALHNVHMQTVMAPNTPFEAVAVELLAMADTCRAQLEARLAQTHPIYRDWVDDTPGVEDPAPRHITAFPSLPVGREGTAAFCERIARDPGVVLVPGDYFHWPGRPGANGRGNARIGLGGPPEQLQAGLAALADLLP